MTKRTNENYRFNSNYTVIIKYSELVLRPNSPFWSYVFASRGKSKSFKVTST